MRSFVIGLLLTHYCLGEYLLPTPEYIEEKLKEYRNLADCLIPNQRNLKIDNNPSVITNLEIEDDSPVIQASTFGEGSTTITGFTMNSTHGRTVYAFQGFRYADGTMRFSIADPVDQFWEEDNFNATEVGPRCPQMSGSGESEDCLYANVYTPYLPDEQKDRKLPVMVFIHGGAFVFGSGNGFYPYALLNYDVVLVTINYRLGTLGFFTLNNDDAPGNYALYDQREALRWVKKHISDFGGDVDSITVFGESAGSVSVSYMTLVADKDTIHRAISESGTTAEVWSVDYDPEGAAHFVANRVNCLDDENKINMTCMREVEYAKITRAGIILTVIDRYNGLIGFRGCSPTIQGSSVTEKILPKLGLDFYIDGDALDIAYMMGANKQEGSLITQIAGLNYLLLHGYLLEDVYMREKAIEDIMASFGVVDHSHGITNTMIRQYCSDFDLGHAFQAMPCMIDMFGVMFLKSGGWKIANYHSHFTTQPTYFYAFEFDPDGYNYNPECNILYDKGVQHGEELQYLFPGGQLEGSKNITSERMTLMWTNFAIYGDPTPGNHTTWQDMQIPYWKPYHHDHHDYLLMRDEFIMQKEYPLRWSITVDEIMAGGEITMEPPETAKEDYGKSHVKQSNAVAKSSSITQNDIDEMKDKRDIYMITMDVFMGAFIFSVGFDIYLYLKVSK